MLNNFKKRALTLLLSLAMIITYMPASMIAYAVDADEQAITTEASATEEAAPAPAEEVAEPESSVEETPAPVEESTEVEDAEPAETEAEATVEEADDSDEASAVEEAVDPGDVTKEDEAEEAEEATVEEAEEVEEAKEEFAKGSLKAGNANYEVVVSYGADAEIPDGAKLVLKEFDEDDKEYIEAKEALVADEDGNSAFSQATEEEQEELGMAAFDLTIKDKDGNVVEPHDEVSVSFKLKELPDGVDAEALAASMEIQHLNESSGDVVVEKVATVDGNEARKDDNVGEIDVNQTKETAEVEFKVDGFSTYTLTYNYNSSSKHIHYVDTNGNSLTPNMTPTFNDRYAMLIYDIDGYEYDSTHVGSITGTQIPPILRGSSNNDNWYYSGNAQYRNGNNWSNLSNSEIYVVYKAKTNPTTGGTPDPVDLSGEKWPDAPTFSKSSVNNGNGTNTVSLRITSPEKPVSKGAKADVIVVFDNSGSMDYNLSGDTKRLDAAKTAVNTMAKSLLDGEGNDVRMALISFSTTGTEVQGFTDSYTTFRDKVNGLGAAGGTNWEKALQMANRMATDPKRATYIVFVTDGDPTFRVSRGKVTDNDLDFYNHTGQQNVYNYYYNNLVFGPGDNDDKGYNFNFAVDEVKSIKASNKQFYAVGVSSDVTKVQTLTTQGGYEANHAFLATSTTALNNAIASITQSIQATLGYGDAEINDGITELTNMNMKVMYEVDTGSFQYYRYGGENNKYGADEAHKTEWTTREADGCGPATYSDGAVHWNMGEGFQLEKDVTYIVTFRVWPSQEAYDLVADLNNGVKVYEEGQPNSITDEERSQVVEAGKDPVTSKQLYALKTNTDELNATVKKTSDQGGTVTISDTQPVNARFVEGTIQNMDLASELLTIQKIFDQSLDPRTVDSVTLKLQRKVNDDEHEMAAYNVPGTDSPYIELNNDNDWKISFYVAPGFIVDGKTLETGYQFTVTEPDLGEHNVRYDLIPEIINPMVVDGTLQLIGDGDGNEALTAINRTRSAVEIHKTLYDVDGTTEIYPDTEFTITGSLLGPDGQPYTNQVAADPVAYYIYDRDGNPKSTERQHFPDSSNISFTLKAGEFLRFVNVPEGCTFVFEEDSIPDNYELNSLAAVGRQRAETDPPYTYSIILDDAVAHLVEGTTRISTTAEGIIGNTNYKLDFYNQRIIPLPEIELVKVDQKDTTKKLNDAEFELHKDSATGTIVAADGNGNPIAIKTGNKEGSTGPDGWYSIGVLPAGTYYMVESKAPSGYVLDKTPVIITVTKDDDSYSVTATKDGKNVLSGPTDGVYTITVDNKLATTIVSGEKTWENGYFGDAATVVVALMKQIAEDSFAPVTDEQGNPVTANVQLVDGKWSYTFTGLTKYAEDGITEIVYKVVEKQILDKDGNDISDQFTAEDSLAGDEDANGVRTANLENKRNKGNLIIKKVVVGDNVMPDTAEFTITGPKDFTPVTVKYSEFNDKANNQHKLNNIPVGKYTVTESGADATGYTLVTTYSPAGPAGEGGEVTSAEVTVRTKTDAQVTVTNTYTTETTDATVKKIWNDANNQDGKRPTSLTVQLLADEVEVEGKTVTLNAANSWEGTIDNLPLMKNGQEIEYTWDEGTLPAGYELTDTTKEGKITTLTNSYQPESTSVDAEKVWDDNDDATGTRPGSVVFKLYKKAGTTGAETETNITVTLNGEADAAPTGSAAAGYESDAWKAKFINLDKYEDGKLIIYSVKEMDGNKALDEGGVLPGKDGTGAQYAVSYSADKLKVTNKLDTVEAKDVIKVTKNLTGREWTTEDSFTFTIAGTPAPEKSSVTIKSDTPDKTASFGTIVFDQEGTYTYKIKETVPADAEEGVKDGITYDGAEHTVTVKVERKDGKLVPTVDYGEEGATSLTVTNEYHAEGTAELEASKELNGRTLENEQFEFVLTNVTGGAATPVETVKNNAEGKVKFSELTYTEADAGKTFTYEITESKKGAAGYTYDEHTLTATVEVTDNGKGALSTKVTYSGATKFVNTYTASGEATFEASKTLTGRTLANGQFSFQLKDEGGNVIQTVQNNAEGKVAFAPETYTQDDLDPTTHTETFTYTINEVDAGAAGYTYDKHVATVTVTATDNGSGHIDTVVSYKGGTEFVNTYAASGEAQFSVTKSLTGRDLEDDQFEFELKEGGKLLQTKTNKGSTVTFDEITYDQTMLGDHVYTVSEKNTGADGYTYSTNVVTYNVSVTDKGDGTLEVTYEEPDNLVFTNTYEAEGEAEIEVTKVLEGRTLAANQFEFELRDAEGNLKEKVKNDAEGKVKFTKLTYDETDVSPSTHKGSFTYTVTEINDGKPGYTYAGNTVNVTVDLEDKGNGTIESKVTYDPASKQFKNKYSASGEAVIELDKALEGRDLEDQQFEFVLKDKDEKEIEKVKNDAEGKITFSAIKYNEADAGKTFEYTVSEVNAGEAGYTYDSTPMDVTVKVSDNGDGTLATEVTYPTDKEFNNTYEAKGKVVLNAKKQLSGRVLEADQFTFNLIDEEGTVIQTKKNAADGTVTFDAINYTEADVDATTHTGKATYTIVEVNDKKAGYTYDDKVVNVTVSLEDNGDGTITATPVYSPAAEFINTYNAEGKAVLEVEKALTGRKLVEGQFTFELRDKDKELLDTKTNAANGKVTFDAIEYTEADAGKTFEYTITEIDAEAAAYTYDGKTVTATVKVTDNGDGTLKTEVTYDDKDAFKNTYEATGDVQFVVNKELNGKTLAADQFTFNLKDEEGNVIQTKKNAANGTVTFDKITYTQDDVDGESHKATFKYTIEEVNDAAAGYTYDSHKVEVTVDVTDNGDGTLTAKDSYKGALKFVNDYNSEGKAQLTAKKVLTGRALDEGEFTFELRDDKNNVLQTKSNAADGTVTFDEITYTQADVDGVTGLGSKTYTIHEVSDADKTWFVYDTDDETVTVTLEDDGKGTITATPDKTGAQVQFDNEYKASGSVVIEAKKVLEGRTLEAGQFTFQILDAEGNVVEEATNDADGKVVFDAIEYDQDDVPNSPIKYTVVEVIPDDAEDNVKDGYTYDDNKVEVNVTLVDDKKGHIAATADKKTADLTFTNEYEAKGDLDFSGLKNLKRGNLKDQSFEFELVQVKKSFLIFESEERIGDPVKVDGSTLTEEYVAGSDTSEEFAFDTITFTKNKDKDECGTYYYIIRELVPEDAVNAAGKKYKDASDEEKEAGGFIKGNYEYDSHEQKITVTVSDNGNGTLKIEKDPASTGKDVTFENVKRFTDIEITKELNAFVETNAEEVTLAFEITGGKNPDGSAFRAAAGLTFTEDEVKAGTPKSVTVYRVPTDAQITVKEVYASNFKPTNGNPQTAKLNKDGVYTVEFKNSYNDNIIYNTGAINKYTQKEGGGYNPPGTAAPTTEGDGQGDQPQN